MFLSMFLLLILRLEKMCILYLFTFLSRIQRIMQTHGDSFGNSFSTCIGQQIQLYTSRSDLRQHKFSDIGNRIFFKKNTAQQGSSDRHLVVKVETAQIHRYRQQLISLGEVQHSIKIL